MSDPAQDTAQQTMSAGMLAEANLLAATREQLDVALRAGQLGLWELDVQTQVVHASEMCKANFGRTKDEPFTYTDLFDTMHPDDREWVLNTLTTAIETRTHYTAEYRIVLPNGETRWIAAHGNLISNTDNRPCLVGVTQDVTSRRRDAEERDRLFQAERSARLRADDASRVKTEFLATMSHELRTPLNAIAGYAQLLETEVYGPVNEAQVQALERIVRSQRHLLRLINDILNFARVESGHVAYDIRPIRLTHAVQEAVGMMEPQFTAKSLEAEVRLGTITPLVLGDEEKLEQILINLLSNAVKFTASGGRLTIDFLERDETPSVVYLRVSDTGRGIPRDKLERVFEPFVQVDAGLTRTIEGTGLGLAISRDLARGMGGDLRARSVVGEGSTFTLTLRRASEGEGAATGA